MPTTCYLSPSTENYVSDYQWPQLTLHNRFLKTFVRLATAAECDSIIEMSMLNAKIKSQELEPDKAKKKEKIKSWNSPKMRDLFFSLSLSWTALGSTVFKYSTNHLIALNNIVEFYWNSSQSLLSPRTAIAVNFAIIWHLLDHSDRKACNKFTEQMQICKKFQFPINSCVVII